MPEVTISLDVLLKGILIIVAVIALIYLIIVLSKMAKALSSLPSTMQHVDQVMADVEKIVGVAKDGAEGAKAVVGKASAALTGVNDVIDTNKGTLKAATSFVNSVTSLASLLKKSKK